MSAACDFCYHHCRLEEGQEGICHVRRNRGGTIETAGYGDIVAMSVDPIEKKPLYHFMPGSRTFSFALFGCNFACDFCQNCAITQNEYRGTELHGASLHLECTEIVDRALEAGCPSVSYTYSEPIVWQDYLAETATLARSAGLKNIMVTNGSFSPEALERLLPLVDAFNIDVKGDDRFYRDVCHGALQPVLDSIATVAASTAHLEVTTMVIEGMHTAAMIGTLGRELADRGVQVWHLSRFFPRYKLSSRMPTSEQFLSSMLQVAKQSGIPYIYGGNSARNDATYCPVCHSLLLGNRPLIPTEIRTIRDGCCVHCHNPVYGVFS